MKYLLIRRVIGDWKMNRQEKLEEIKKLAVEKIERDRIKEENEKLELERSKKEWNKIQDECWTLLDSLPEGYEFRVEVEHPWKGDPEFGNSSYIYIKKGAITGYDYLVDKVQGYKRKDFHGYESRGIIGNHFPLAGYGFHPTEQEKYEALANSLDSVLDQITEQLKK